MVIMVVEKVPVSLRGELTHWLLEVKTGVYIGDINARVRDRLWRKCCERKGAGVVFQAWSTNTEQGYQMRLEGESYRKVVDWEGIQMITDTSAVMTGVQLRRIKGDR